MIEITGAVSRDFAAVIAVMLGLGAGIDYALLIIGRYREQIAAGDSTRDASAKAAATSGASVVAAGVIVMVYISLGGLSSAIYNEVLQFFLIVAGFVPLVFLVLLGLQGAFLCGMPHLRWPTATGVVDPFRPGLRYHARSEREFDLLTAAHLRAVRAVFEQATVFIFTLGLTEAWCSTADGAVYPACPGTVAGEFDPQRHRLINFRVDEVIADLGAVIELARTINPTLRWVLTVSPVPLVATATGRHVLTASTYSKAVLRVAADDMRIPGFTSAWISASTTAPHLSAQICAVSLAQKA